MSGCPPYSVRQDRQVGHDVLSILSRDAPFNLLASRGTAMNRISSGVP